MDGDDDMEECRFPGAGLARHQHVLAGALSKRQHLQFFRSGATDWHAELVRGIGAPTLGDRRRDVGKRHLHAVGVGAGATDAMD